MMKQYYAFNGEIIEYLGEFSTFDEAGYAADLKYREFNWVLDREGIMKLLNSIEKLVSPRF